MEMQDALAAKMAVEARFKTGARWFFWIAGLSLVNTVLIASGSSITFVIGLGATIFIDAAALALRNNGADPALVLPVAFALDAFVAGLFVLFGVLASKRHSVAFIIGMTLYALDALLMIVLQDWLSAAFHGLALWGLFQGLRACRALGAAEEAVRLAVTTDAQKSAAEPPVTAPPAAPGSLFVEGEPEA